MTDTAPPSSPIACPKCRAAMTPTPAGEVMIDCCPACGGIWFDTLELEKVAANKGVATAIDRAGPTGAGGVSGAKWCPRDTSSLIPMTALRQPHVRYESCTVCGGAFLDAGELRDLAHLSLRERLRSVFG